MCASDETLDDMATVTDACEQIRRAAARMERREGAMRVQAIATAEAAQEWRITTLTRERDDARAEVDALAEGAEDVRRALLDCVRIATADPCDGPEQLATPTARIVAVIRESIGALHTSRDAVSDENERLHEQVRVWRTLARDGSIASADLGVIGATEAALAMGRGARRAKEHAAQGASAEREACMKLVGAHAGAMRLAEKHADCDADEAEYRACAERLEDVEALIRARGTEGT